MSVYTLRLLADGGRAVAEKAPCGVLPPAERRAAEDRLRHEASMLEVATHPGVVELRELRDDPTGVVLRTALVPGRALADVAAGELTVTAAAGITIALATTVADLHERGVVHGRLDDPAHVLLPPAGPPVICGFGDASAGPAPVVPDAAAVDVAAVGTLLLRLLGDTPPDGVEAATAGALETLARRARGAAAARPTARSLAAGLRDAVPDADRAGPRRAEEPPDVQRQRATWRDARSLRAAVSGAAGLTALVVALVLLGGGDGRGAPAGAGPVDPPVAHPSPQRAGGTPAPAPAAPPVVHAAGRRFQIGAPGDLVLVADWPCGPDPVAVVVRPGTGSVTVFDRWAEPGEVLAGRHLVRVGPVTAAVVTEGEDGCGAVEVEHLDGSTSIVELGAPAG